jgi:hypothetical protein
MLNTLTKIEEKNKLYFNFYFIILVLDGHLERNLEI